MAVWMVTAILIITLILLITEKLPVDLTAIGIMVALMTSGILSPLEAVAGFANPAVVTVGAMFLISKSMIRTGAVGFIGETVIHLSRGRAKLARGCGLYRRDCNSFVQRQGQACHALGPLDSGLRLWFH